MSRIGNNPVTVPKGVTVTTAGRKISVKGPQGQLEYDVPEPIGFSVENGVVNFTRPNDERNNRALHGLARARTRNMMEGASVGFRRVLEIVGVGYRAAVRGNAVDLTLGFSHPVSYELPAGVKAEVTKEGSIILTSPDRAVLGQVAADIRSFRPPEPYKGKGIRYQNENIIRKEGKARGKK